MYRLDFRSSEDSPKSFGAQRVLRIGRNSADNDIVLDSPGVSRRHAELRPTAAGWQLVDVGSSGGTWVNNQRVEQIALGATTAVRFGAQRGGIGATIAVEMPDSAKTVQLPDRQNTVLLSDQQATYISGPGETPAG